MYVWKGPNLPPESTDIREEILRTIENSWRPTTAQNSHHSFKIRTPKEFIDDTGEKHIDGIGSNGLTEVPFLGQKCHEHP